MISEPGVAVVEQIAQALRSLRYGTVQITVHNGRVVQIDKVERVRLAPDADPTTGRAAGNPPIPDRTTGGDRTGGP